MAPVLSRIRTTLCLVVIFFAYAPAQESGTEFTRADTLRGMLSPLRSCYDVTMYDLSVRVDPNTQSITGTNTIAFRVVEPYDSMQLDLFDNMRIESIVDDEGRPLEFRREYHAVMIRMNKRQEQGRQGSITVAYSGSPQVAKRPPWDGGFIWTKDSAGTPWIAVACQGTGASLWWPCKDHQSDEPDSMRISVTVPPGLTDISNGRLRDTVIHNDGWTTFNWFVSSPINTYNVTLNIGSFARFGETIGDLTLDYYVKPYNIAKARTQFAQVKPMMECFERYFGLYPFMSDGFKLVESPHLGMEHQSAVAYGNAFLQGYSGTASSEIGLSFDFIIIHESAHEWWGNNVSSKDIADMWIHESFGSYAEGIYVECLHGYDAAMDYVNAKKQIVGNTRPIIGVYNVNKSGSGDMYPKGALMLNTIRHILDNDSLWFSIVRGIQETFRHRTITTEDIVGYVNSRAESDLTPVFDQYLRFSRIPQLDVTLTKKGEHVSLRYKWTADVDSFTMPVKVSISKDRFGFIQPTKTWQTMELQNLHPEDFKVAEDQFYVTVKQLINYVDPRKPEAK